MGRPKGSKNQPRKLSGVNTKATGTDKKKQKVTKTRVTEEQVNKQRELIKDERTPSTIPVQRKHIKTEGEILIERYGEKYLFSGSFNNFLLFFPRAKDLKPTVAIEYYQSLQYNGEVPLKYPDLRLVPWTAIPDELLDERDNSLGTDDDDEEEDIPVTEIQEEDDDDEGEWEVYEPST